MTEIIQPQDYVASALCPRAAAEKDYTPAEPFEIEKGGALLLNWAQDQNPWQRHASDPVAVQQWMLQTKLSLLLKGRNSGPNRPPEPKNGLWLPSNKLCNFEGRVSVEIMGQTIDAELRLPFYHETESAREVVFCDLSSRPITRHQWTLFAHRAKWTRAVFNRITEETLYVRYIAPIRQVERRLQIPRPGLDRLARHVLTSQISPITRPGDHCDQTKTKGRNREYRCPLREQNLCNPYTGSP